MRKADQEIQKKFRRGIAVLFVFIFSGVFLVELQLNDLTQNNEFTKVLNIRRDQATQEIGVYFLGECFTAGQFDYGSVEQDARIYYLKAASAVYDLQMTARRYYTEFF